MFGWAYPSSRWPSSDEWFDWPALTDLFPVSFPGVKTSRDGLLVDVDLDCLRARVRDYFDRDLSHEEIGRRYSGVMKGHGTFRRASDTHCAACPRRSRGIRVRPVCV